MSGTRPNDNRTSPDFRDAALVYECEEKCTYASDRHDEDVRIISFRVASREERAQYEQDVQ